MTWAWAAALPPTPKLVLMALADIADDHGLCWPSVKALARKCSISERSVQRILQVLQSRELLSIAPQFRKDGSRTSSRYRLAVDAPPPGQVDRGWGHACQGELMPASPAGDIGVAPRTTSEPVIEPTPLQHAASGLNVLPAERDSGGGRALIFPNSFTQRHKQTLHRCVASLAPENAQQVLDELAGRMAITTVKNPVRYCVALVERMQRGDFQAELGLQVVERRQWERLHSSAGPRGDSPASIETKASLERLSPKLRASLARIRAVTTIAGGTHHACESPSDSVASRQDAGTQRATAVTERE